MDIFAMIELSSELKNKLEEVSLQVQQDFKGSYVEKEKYHITLRFFSNVREDELRQIKTTIKDVVARTEPFDLYCNELRLLDSSKKSPLIYSVKGSVNKLNAFEQILEDALYNKNIQRNLRDFMPHITLGRKVPFAPLPHIKPPTEKIKVGSIILMESIKKFGGTLYKEIERFSFEGGMLYIEDVKDDVILCENSYGHKMQISKEVMPNNIKEKDVVKKTGTYYTIDDIETSKRKISGRRKLNSVLNKTE